MKLQLTLIIAIVLSTYTLSGQVFYQESFEDETGWSLSHTFDNGSNKYAKRDLAENFTGLEFTLFGQDGEYVIGAENTDTSEPGAPETGIVFLTFDPIDVSGKSNLQAVVSIACNNNDQSYDDRSLPEGDYLDFDFRIDGGFWSTFGSINASAGSVGNSGLYHDVNQNGNGGEIGEVIVSTIPTDFVFPIDDAGSSLEIRARFIMTESTEEIIFDNVRIRENTLDDTPPTINSVSAVNDHVIRVFFNEGVDDNSIFSSMYTGVSNLESVVLENSNFEALLTYSESFDIGVEYNMVIFGVQDMAGNNMATPFLHNFYFNPTNLDLLITEIMYNDPSDIDSLEYIEVYNNDTETIKLGGLRILGAVDFTFPEFDLSPGNYYLIARKLQASMNFYSQNFGNYSGSLSNSGEAIVIKNTFGTNVNIVNYDTDLPWPPGGDGSGSSIFLVDYNSNNNVGNNWAASTEGIGFVNGEAVNGTPGSASESTLPIIQFIENEYSINETDGTVEIALNISASNSNISSVVLSIASNSSGSSEDLNLMGIETVTFNPNINSVVTVTIPIIDDASDEGFEFIILELGGYDNATSGFNNSTAILISDDEFIAPELYINELQSSNFSDVTDEFNQHDDWFEIYNPNDFSVDLAGYYISDNAIVPTKDRVIYGTTSSIVPANSWILFWADEDKSQGDLHVSFKLSSTGEYLSLRHPNGITLIDQIAFPALEPDKSYGRSTDGADNWITFISTTPDSSNFPDGIGNNILPLLSVYPNPVSEVLRWQGNLNIELYNLHGQYILRETTDRIDVTKLTNGIYVLKSVDGSFLPVNIIVKK